MLKMVRGRPAAAIVYEPMRVYKTEVQNDRPITVNDNPYLIGTAELQSLLHDRELRIVDCRFELLRPEAGRAGSTGIWRDRSGRIRAGTRCPMSHLL
jgi:hypothetical protein